MPTCPPTRTSASYSGTQNPPKPQGANSRLWKPTLDGASKTNNRFSLHNQQSWWERTIQLLMFIKLSVMEKAPSFKSYTFIRYVTWKALFKIRVSSVNDNKLGGGVSSLTFELRDHVKCGSRCLADRKMLHKGLPLNSSSKVRQKSGTCSLSQVLPEDEIVIDNHRSWHLLRACSVLKVSQALFSR